MDNLTDYLPDEIIGEIIKYIYSSKTIISLSSTSKRFFDFFYSNNVYNKSTEAKFILNTKECIINKPLNFVTWLIISEDETSSFVPSMIDYFPNLLKLEHYSHNITPVIFIKDTPHDELFKNCNNLKELIIDNYYNLLCNPFENMKNLINLKCTHCIISDSSCFTKLDKLEKLDISHTYTEYGFEFQNPNLKSLISTNSDNTHTFLSKLHALNELNINFSFFRNYTFSDNVNLETLCCARGDFYYNISDNIFYKLENLRYLDISFWKHLKNPLLYMSKLEVLVAINCVSLCDTAFDNVPLLKEVNISRCSSLVSPFKNIIDLQRATMKDCPGLHELCISSMVLLYLDIIGSPHIKYHRGTKKIVR